MEDKEVDLQNKPFSGLSFTFSDDVIVEELETPETPPAAPETVKESAEALIETVKEVEQAPEETPTSSNNFSLLLKSFQVTDKLIPEDVEIPDELDGTEFKKFLKEAVKKEVLAESAPDIEEREAKWLNYLQEKGITEEQIEFASARAYGVQDETLSRVAQLRNLATAELQDDKEREYVVRTKLALEGNKPSLIDTYIQNELSDEEKLKEAADEAQVALGQMADAEFEEQKQAAIAAKKADEEKAKEQRTNFEKIIDNGFFGIKLPKEEKEALKKYMFESNVVKHIDTPQGKKPIARPQEAWDLQELEKDPEKRIFFSYLVRNGLQNAVTTLHKVASDDFLKKIETKHITPQKEVISDKEDEFISTLGKSIISLPNRR